MGDILQVRGTPILKIKSEKRIIELRKGNVYCKRLQYYIDLEKEQGDIIVGDAWEAALPLRDAHIYIPGKECVEHVSNTAISSKVANDFVFCMTGCKLQNYENDLKLIDDEVLKFGDYSLLITDMDEFVNRLQQSATTKGFALVRHGFVNYYDEEYDNTVMIQDIINSTANIAFWKRKRYKSQSEYRFLFRGDTEMDHIQFDIGALDDISVILNANQLKKAYIKRESEVIK